MAASAGRSAVGEPIESARHHGAVHAHSRLPFAPMNQRPVLMLNPRDDEAFGELVTQLVAGGIETTGALQAALRDRYPAAVVHQREISSERAVVWYVYRDGRWIGPGGAARG